MLEREFHPDQRRLHQLPGGLDGLPNQGIRMQIGGSALNKPGISNPCEVETMAAMAHRNVNDLPIS